MVIADGDLPGYYVQSTGAEVLADQLPPPHAPQGALESRLITANWVASEHSTLGATAKADPVVFSDANLFKSAAALRRIWVLENAPVPGIKSQEFAPPPGAPDGAHYAYVVDSGGAAYQISWTEGRVLGIVAVTVSPQAHLSAGALTKIAVTLDKAAKAESILIAGAANMSSATV